MSNLYLDWTPGEGNGKVKNSHKYMNDIFKEQITTHTLTTIKVRVI